MTVLDHVALSAERLPNKPAIIHRGQVITYAELLPLMQECQPLPIPLLGEGWDKPFCLHTTGTTGKAKDVVIGQHAVLCNSENLIHAHGYTEETVFILAGALDHLGCWSKIFPVLMQGGTLVVLDGLKDMDAFLSAFDYPSSHLATFLVPAAIRMLLQFDSERLSHLAHKIDFIETGAAAISLADMQRLCHLLPNTRLFNTYASTETGILCTYNFNDGGECIPGCVGRPMLHAHVFITPEGQIACQGPTLMTGYRGDEKLTQQVLRDGIFYTADNGSIDHLGRLHILGRRDDIINVGGYKVSPYQVEEAALAFPAVADCVCIPIPHPLTGQALKLLVVPSTDTEYSAKALALFLKSRLETYQVPLFYQSVDKIERTHNGKINRRFYAEASGT